MDKVKIIKEENGTEEEENLAYRTDGEILSSLARNMGMFYLACKELDMSEDEVKARLRKNPKIAQEYFAIIQRIGDAVETGLIQRALEGDQRATEYYLNAKHKDRGYGIKDSTRQNISINANNITLTQADMQQQVIELQESFLKTLEAHNAPNSEVVEVVDVPTKKENEQ